MRSKNPKNLEKYISSLNRLWSARQIAIDSLNANVARLIRDFVIVETAVYERSRELRSAVKRACKKPDVDVFVEILPGANNRLLLRGPSLVFKVSNTRVTQSMPMTKTEAMALCRKIFEHEHSLGIAVRMAEVGQLHEVYLNIYRRLTQMIKALQLPSPKFDKTGARGYLAFVEKRQPFLSTIESRVKELTKRLLSLKEELDDAMFHFNSIGGKTRGYHALVLSWDVDFNPRLRSGFHPDNQLTYKYVAYNKGPGHISRNINQLDSASKRTIRPTKGIIKALGLDRYRKPTLEWLSANDHKVTAMRDTLTLLATLEEIVVDV